MPNVSIPISSRSRPRSVPCAGGLDSLLDPQGTLKEAHAKAARAFQAQHTFFVTNGTSTANKIVGQALLRPGDIVLIDRDCHKVRLGIGISRKAPPWRGGDHFP